MCALRTPWIRLMPWPTAPSADKRRPALPPAALPGHHRDRQSALRPAIRARLREVEDVGVAELGRAEIGTERKGDEGTPRQVHLGGIAGLRHALAPRAVAHHGPAPALGFEPEPGGRSGGEPS